MLQQAKDTEEIIARIAALDIGKATLTCCVRVPNPDHPGKRLQEVATHATMTRSLLVLADRLRALGVTRVVMEATSDYWKPPLYLLEAAGFETWLVNANEIPPPSRRWYALSFADVSCWILVPLSGEGVVWGDEGIRRSSAAGF